MNDNTSIHLPGGAHATLLLHGLASSPLEVRFIAKLLHRAGFSVFMPVIAGYSRATQITNWRDWMDKTAEIHRTLCSQYKTVSVGGLSAGATLALAFAAKTRSLQALALWGVTLYYDGWAIPWYHWLFTPCYLLGLGRFYAYQEREPFGLKNERWRARVAQAMRTQQFSTAGPASITADFLHQARLLGRFAERNLAHVTADTLVIHSADDETASPRNAQVVYEGIGAERKRKIMLGDSYHMITIDNERDLVARETIRFFQESIMRKHPDENIRLVSSTRALLRLQRQRSG